MQFRTELHIPETNLKITHQDKIFCLGSCFAQNIANQLHCHKFNVLNNPFGVLFHPIAIETALNRIRTNIPYTESEITQHKGLYFSWDHHSKFNQTSLQSILQNINHNLHQSNQCFKQSNLFILTFGTSWVYQLKEYNEVVANCHKMPNHYFNKTLLPLHQVQAAIKNCIDLILDWNPAANIILSVSPVRHKKDGLIENNLSKSQLIYAVHNALANYQNAHYFPAYELVLDDLRDYRFYAKDLVHINDLALDYVWEKFSDLYFNQETKQINTKAQQLNTAMQHQIQNPKSIAAKQFYYQTLKLAQSLDSTVNNQASQQDIMDIKQKIKDL